MKINYFSLIATVLLSIFSTAVLSYISMAVMIGPWIHTTIILILTFIFSYIVKLNHENKNKEMALITSGASIGGILATGCGFAFPTLYFLNKELFNCWLDCPIYFILTVSGICFISGALGLIIANIFSKQFIETQALPFPISQINYKLITVQQNSAKSIQLIIGFIITFIYNLFFKFSQSIKSFTVNNKFSVKFIDFPSIKLPVLELPMLLAIGFVTGHVIAFPLAVGIISKIGVMDPVNKLLFSDLKPLDFSLAFITGMVIFGTALSFFQIPQFISWLINKSKNLKNLKIEKPTTQVNWHKLLIVLAAISIFLYQYNFGLIFQIYLVLATALCTYQIMPIGAEFGIAPVARYATFVMMPALFIFGYNPVHLTLISTFVEVCGGVAVDVLFGQKLGQLTEVDQRTLRFYQWLGLIISSISVGLFVYILIKKFGLGSPELVAQRGQTRALTVNCSTFDIKAMVFGALYGATLKELKINPIMVLGGLLMPIEWSIILVTGGLISYIIKNREDYYPFWSGVFSSSSLLMILRALA